MSKNAPIDVDVSEAAALFDFENIRLSWEKAYGRLFRYTDLCWLCELVEMRFGAPIGRVIIFMSDPRECEFSVGPEQLDELKRIFKYLNEDQARTQSRQKSFSAQSYRRTSPSDVGLQGPAKRRKGPPQPFHPPGDIVVLDDSENEEEGDYKVQSNEEFPGFDNASFSRGDSEVCSNVSDESAHFSDLRASRTEGIGPKKQPDSGSQTKPLEEDALSSSATGETRSCSSSEAPGPSTVNPAEPTSEPFVRLGLDVASDADVSVRVFGYKQNGRRRIQRACDVAIGNEVTKLCFMPRFSQIYLFSADSDFEETALSCAQAEDVGGGVIKYAKQIRIFGFSQAFQMRTALAVRAEYQRMSSRRKRRGSSKQLQIHFIDYEFPIIRRIVKQRPMLVRKPHRVLLSPEHSVSAPESVVSSVNSCPQPLPGPDTGNMSEIRTSVIPPYPYRGPFAETCLSPEARSADVIAPQFSRDHFSDSFSDNSGRIQLGPFPNTELTTSLPRTPAPPLNSSMSLNPTLSLFSSHNIPPWRKPKLAQPVCSKPECPPWRQHQHLSMVSSSSSSFHVTPPSLSESVTSADPPSLENHHFHPAQKRVPPWARKPLSRIVYCPAVSSLSCQ